MKRLTLFLILVLTGPTAIAVELHRDSNDQVNQETAGDYAVYGNWCGPDHPQTLDPAPRPLDLVDQACMRHDYCYVEKGYFNCDCDMDLVDELGENLAAGKYSVGAEERYARSIYRYFAASPCTGDDSRKQESARRLNELIKKTKDSVTDWLKKKLDDDSADAPAAE